MFVKDVSCLKAHEIKELTPFSAASDWSYKNNLTFFTCAVKRSVGVGFVGLGFETGDVGDGLGVVGAVGGSE